MALATSGVVLALSFDQSGALVRVSDCDRLLMQQVRGLAQSKLGRIYVGTGYRARPYTVLSAWLDSTW